MRRLLALALWLCLGVSPAFAGITFIPGTAPRSVITDITFNAGTSVGLVTTASIPAGSLVVVLMQNATTGTSTGFSCSDTHSNTYTAPRAVDQNNGAATQILYSLTGTTIATGDTITCSQTSGPSGISGEVIAFSGAAATPFDVSAGNSALGATGAMTIGPTATLACPGGGASCEVLVGGVSLHTAGTVTQDGAYTDLASGAGSNWGNGYKIVSATTAQSYAPSTSSTGNWAGQLLAFKAAVASTSSYGGGTTVGVGH